MALTAVQGIGLIHSMAQVHHLPAVPAWNTWRTNVGFMVSALLPGRALMAALVAYEANSSGIQSSTNHWIKIGILLRLLLQFLLMHKQFPRSVFQNIRTGIILTGMALPVPTMFLIDSNHALLSSLIFLVVVVIEEGIGRWLFYESHTQMVSITNRCSTSLIRQIYPGRSQIALYQRWESAICGRGHYIIKRIP